MCTCIFISRIYFTINVIHLLIGEGRIESFYYVNKLTDIGMQWKNLTHFKAYVQGDLASLQLKTKSAASTKEPHFIIQF